MGVFEVLTIVIFHGARFCFVDSNQVHGTRLFLENSVNQLRINEIENLRCEKSKFKN